MSTTQFDALTFTLDEMDYFADGLGFEVEDMKVDDDGALDLPDGVPMRKFMRVVSTIISRRENPDVADDEIGSLTMGEITDMFVGEDDDVNPTDGQPD